MLKKLLFILLLSSSINVFSTEASEKDPKIELMNIIMGVDIMDYVINQLYDQIIQNLSSEGVDATKDETLSKLEIKKLFSPELIKMIHKALESEFTKEEIVQLVTTLKTTNLNKEMPLIKKFLSRRKIIGERFNKILDETEFIIKARVDY